MSEFRRASSIRRSRSWSRPLARPVVFNSPHSGPVYPRALPHRLAARSRDAAPLRGQLRRRLSAAWSARLSADAGALSALPRSTSTASPTNSIRACSPAGCRPSPIPARCGWPAGSAPSPAWSATRRRSIDERLAGRRGAAADRERSTSPITARCGGCSCGAHRDIRHRRAGRLPFDAVDAPAPRTSGRAPTWSSAIVTARAARRGRRNGRGHAASGSAIRSAATSPMPAASSPSTTAIRPPGCTRSRSRSTARSTWTSGAASERRLSRGSARPWNVWPTVIGDIRRRASALPGSGGISHQQKKGRSEQAAQV